MKGLFNITYTTASQARREPIYYIVTGIFAALVYLTQYFVLFIFQGEEAVVMETGIASITACGYLLAVLLSWLLVRKEMEQMSILTVLSKPVSRFSFISGKYLGLLYAIFLSVLFLFLMFCLNLWQFDGLRILDQVSTDLNDRYLHAFQANGELPGGWTVMWDGLSKGLGLFFKQWIVSAAVGTLPAFLSIAIVLSVTTVLSVFFEVLPTTAFTIGFLMAGSLSGSMYEVLAQFPGTSWFENSLGWVIHLLIPDLYQLNIASNVGSRLNMTAADLSWYYAPFMLYSTLATLFFVGFVLCVGTAIFQRQEIT